MARLKCKRLVGNGTKKKSLFILGGSAKALHFVHGFPRRSVTWITSARAKCPLGHRR